MYLLLAGFQCLRGITPDCAGDCSRAPLIATAYVACNLGLNISLLALLRQAGDIPVLIFFKAVPQAHEAARSDLVSIPFGKLICMVSGLVRFCLEKVVHFIKAWKSCTYKHRI